MGKSGEAPRGKPSRSRFLKAMKLSAAPCISTWVPTTKVQKSASFLVLSASVAVMTT